MITNAEAVARALARSGVQIAFGLPGGEVAALIDACRTQGIRFLLAGHETSAAFMAEVTGQITGHPGVCISTLGPGAMNLCLGVANAFLDRAPLLAISADLPLSKMPHFPHQRLPITTIFSNFSKLSVRLDGEDTTSVVNRCIETALAPRPGPVHIALPSDVAVERANNQSKLVTYHSAATLVADERLGEAAEVLSKAKTPLLVVGLGCRMVDISFLRAFVAETGIPYVVTPKAKGSLAEDAPGFLGVAGGMALDRVVLETIDMADLLLGVGFDPVECDKDWYMQKRIINLDRVATAEGAYQPLDVIGDVGSSLGKLNSLIQHRLAWPQKLVAERRKAVRPATGKPPADAALSPLDAVRNLREVLPPETVLTCDVGSHKYYAAQFWESYEPGKFLVSNGLSSMGYGVPAAIAAKIQFPNVPVVSLVGDGGMQMMLHNLTFVHQYDVPIIIVVFADGSLSLIRVSQDRKGYGAYGVDFPSPNFVQIATAHGLEGVHVRTVGELRKAVDCALNARQATLIQVPIDLAEYYEFV